MGPIGAPGLKINEKSHEEHRERASDSERASAKFTILIVEGSIFFPSTLPQGSPGFPGLPRVETPRLAILLGIIGKL